MITPDASRRGYLPNPELAGSGPPPQKLAMYDTGTGRKKGAQYRGRQPGHSVDGGAFESNPVPAQSIQHQRRVSQGVVGGTN